MKTVMALVIAMVSIAGVLALTSLKTEQLLQQKYIERVVFHSDFV
ncbi:hypothetical protein [Cysteiniphilum litorale]